MNKAFLSSKQESSIRTHVMEPAKSSLMCDFFLTWQSKALQFGLAEDLFVFAFFFFFAGYSETTVALCPNSSLLACV